MECDAVVHGKPMIDIRPLHKKGVRDWTGLGSTGMDWNQMKWIGLDWTGLDWNGMEHRSEVGSRAKGVAASRPLHARARAAEMALAGRRRRKSHRPAPSRNPRQRCRATTRLAFGLPSGTTVTRPSRRPRETSLSLLLSHASR